MGVVYPEQDVALGNVPAADGTDHLQAARLFFDSLTNTGTPTYGNVRVMLLGSVVTGRSTRRSDLDYFLVRTPLEGEEGVRQQLHIASAANATRNRYHVRLEGQQFTERYIARNGHNIGDPLWLAHVADIQDNHPGWTHGQPIDQLRPYAIDIRQDLDEPDQRSRLAQSILQYFGHKINIFEEAGDFNQERSSDLHLLQRALEAGKAYARKGIAVMALEGVAVGEADVTDKASMREHAEAILDRIDQTGQLRKTTEVINDLDQEYDHVLDEALSSGSTDVYQRWLSSNYLRACAAALRLAYGYFDYIEDVTWQDDSIVLDRIGDSYADHSMQDSSGEPLEEGSYQAPINPILINLEVDQLDVLIGDPAPREDIPELPTRVLSSV